MTSRLDGFTREELAVILTALSSPRAAPLAAERISQRIGVQLNEDELRAACMRLTAEAHLALLQFVKGGTQ